MSVLIPTLPARDQMLRRLLRILSPQCRGLPVEILIDDATGPTTGEKSNRLMRRSVGDYVCRVDDDDVVSDFYVDETLRALEQKPDCVGWKMNRYSDDGYIGDGLHSLRFKKYGVQSNPNGTRTYLRTPNHLNPIRREIALATPYIDSTYGEDMCFAVQVRPKLKTEVFIDRVMYHYLYRTIARRTEAA